MKASGKKPRSCSDIEPKSTHDEICDQQSSCIEEDGQDDLGNRTPAETFEELGSRLVANGKQKQEKEGLPKNAGYYDFKLPHGDTCQEASDDRAQGEGTDSEAPEVKPGGHGK